MSGDLVKTEVEAIDQLHALVNSQDLQQRYNHLSAGLKRKFAAAKLLALDFDGVLTDNQVYVDQTGREMVKCNRSDTFGLKQLRASKQLNAIIISRETNPIVTVRGRKIGLPTFRSVTDKLETLHSEAKQLKINMSQVAFIGNDIPDLSCLQSAGLGIAVADAFSPLPEIADYVTQATGGHGAVREVIELLILAKLSATKK